MKLFLYKLINKLGYRIEKKKIDKKNIAPFLLKFNSSNFDDLFISRNYIYALSQKYEDFNLNDYENGYLVTFDGNKFFIEGNEEFYILNEIFVDKDYHFETSKKSIIIDIGANVGIASIFFSSNKYIEKIYAFEPVKPTFDQAKRNIEFNHLSEKINIMNFGLGDEDKTLIFKFDSNSKGSAGVSSIKNDRYKNNKNAIDISVEIKNSNEVFEKIIYKYPSHQIIVKMDCEGAENEILKSLIKKQLINKINCFILEWHHDNYSFVTNILLENNFSFFTKSNNYNSGLVLAYKNQTE